MYESLAVHIYGMPKDESIHSGLWPPSLSRPSDPSALQVDTRSHVQHRIITRLNTADSWDGIENDLPLILVVAIHHLVNLDSTQLHNLSIFRPVFGSIICWITLFGDLSSQLEGDWAVNDSGLNVIVEVGSIFCLCLFLREVRFASVGLDAVADERTLAVGGDELEGVYTKVFLGRE